MLQKISPRVILCGLYLLSGFVARAQLYAATTVPAQVFLKWETQLSPRWAAGHWQTGAPDLDAVLGQFPHGMVQPAVPSRLKTDPQGLSRILRIDLNSAAEVSSLLAKLRSLPRTEYAEPRPLRTFDNPHKSPFIKGGLPHQTFDVPGDPLYGEQWFYPLMQAPSAWDLTHSDASVTVAIVDNGTDWGHPDLTENIWSNLGEILGNGVDDDSNGFIDDTRGWDFYDNDNNPAPEMSSGSLDYHGTHTAGLVAAMMGNNRGVVGMAPSCQLMAIRTGYGESIYYGLEGIIYAAHNGADIISLSWGGAGSNAYERDIINDAMAQGCLVVAAAGNEGVSTPHYPAAYDGVLAVAATDPNDVKVGFSNYGSWVSVCAPGLSILSLIPGGYGIASGTSMSTPLVAGVAALVKAYHPTWSHGQLSAQIQNTADDISAKNPLYAGLLGSGRVNAFRAVAESAPGLLLDAITLDDIGGDGDAEIDPGESAYLTMNLINYGAATADVQIQLSYNSSEIEVLQGNWNIAQIPANAGINNASNPFQISVPAMPWLVNTSHLLSLSIQEEGFYSSTLSVPLWISPAFADHDTGNVVFTLTNFGAFGYREYVYALATSPGSGFRFPLDGANALSHGSLMAGVSGAKVSDCAFGGSSPSEGRYDWQVTSSGDLTITPGTAADQEGIASYKDNGAPEDQRVGLAVTQHSYAWHDAPNNDFIIVAFSLKNISGAVLSNLYVGLYMDWDLISYENNEANWNSSRSLGYIYNESPANANLNYYGISLLAGTLKSYRVIDLEADVPSSGVMTDAMKYDFMSAGMIKTVSTVPSDQATLLSAGPYAISPDDSVAVVFAVLGGSSLSDLQNNADAAQAAWGGIASGGDDTPSPLVEKAGISGLQLHEVFPQPANNQVAISLYLPVEGEVAFNLVNLAGRSVRRWKEEYAQAGNHRIMLAQDQLPSGAYWLQGQTTSGRATARIVWIK